MDLLVSYKIDFKTRCITKVEEHFMVLKRSVHQEYITIIDAYVSNKSASKYMKQSLTEPKGEIDKSQNAIS